MTSRTCSIFLNAHDTVYYLLLSQYYEVVGAVSSSETDLNTPALSSNGQVPSRHLRLKIWEICETALCLNNSNIVCTLYLLLLVSYKKCKPYL